jgi:type III restriction enzyme
MANLRLQAMASLPHLAVFSDEAHHTYGQKLLGKWEKTRKPASWCSRTTASKKCAAPSTTWLQETNLIVTINATGTPYFERQPLRDVVVWYGLGEGIRDGVLKELANGIKVLELGDGEADTHGANVIDDFVRTIGVRAALGQRRRPARLALYFPNIETRDELRPSIESALLAHGIGPDTLLAVDNKSARQPAAV